MTQRHDDPPTTPPPTPMTARTVRERAHAELHHLTSGGPASVDSPDARTVPAALVALTYAVLALGDTQPPLEPAVLEGTPQRPAWVDAVILTVLAALVLGLAWIIFR